MGEMIMCADRKGKDLNEIERGRIAAMYEEGYSFYRIGKVLGRSEVTIANEIRRGTVTIIYKGYMEKEIYSPEAGQYRRNKNRKNCFGRNKGKKQCKEFMEYVEHMVLEKKYSVDAAVGYAKKNHLFAPDEMVCTKTIYNYIERGQSRIKNIDLPNKVKRRVKTDRVVERKRKRKFGRSIEERDICINERKEFGHWEIDLMIGKQSGDEALLTLTERVTRKEYIAKISGKTVEGVRDGLTDIFARMGDYKKIVKSITTDNGSEFSKLHELEKAEGIKVYYAHPYSSFERGTNEHCNGIIRRRVPKGKYIKRYSRRIIRSVESWLNEMPRKILGYQSANEAYEKALHELGIAA